MRLICLILFPGLFCANLAAEESLEVVIKAGPHDRSGTPIVAELPEGANLPEWIRLAPVGGSDLLPENGQIIPGKRSRLVFCLNQTLPAGETRRYRIEAGIPTLPMQCEESDSGITVGISEERPILHYVKTPTPDAAKNDPVYTRTGYIHPLFTPAGRIVTGDYPADHPHQHAVFNAWTNTSFEGRKINFWDQKKGHARIAYESTVKTLAGPVFAQFVVTHRHDDLTDPEKPRPVLNETWMVRAYQGDEKYHLIDIRTSQRCATGSPLVINQYHYGGMAIRGTSAWFDPDKDAEPPGAFLTSEGMTRADGNHSRPNWVVMHGPLGGGHAGVAVFSHPDNFRAPQWVRLHPTKPYFVFTPMVEEGFTIDPGAPYVGRYRYAVFDGRPDPELLDRIWNDYAEPPETRIGKTP